MSSNYNPDTLQQLQKLKRFVTYETVLLGVLTYNFLRRKTRPSSSNIHDDLGKIIFNIILEQTLLCSESNENGCGFCKKL